MSALQKTILNADLKIDWVDHKAAEYAVKNWHYSKRMPKSKLAKFGVWENKKFLGVVIYGVGATSTLVKQYGLKSIEGCELVRVALRKHVTPVSRIIAITLKLLKKTFVGLKLVVSFADPDQGHVGGIYQAGGWIYTGKTPDCKFPIFDGRVVHPRVLSLKIKARKIKSRSDVPYKLTKGKYRYLMPLEKEVAARIRLLSKPYPKRALSKDSVASGFQSEEGGAIPTNALQNKKLKTMQTNVKATKYAKR